MRPTKIVSKTYKLTGYEKNVPTLIRTFLARIESVGHVHDGEVMDLSFDFALIPALRENLEALSPDDQFEEKVNTAVMF